MTIDSAVQERIGIVRHFLLSGVSVCPFAKSYADKVRFGYLPSSYSSEDVRAPILEFVTSLDLMATTYIFDSELKTHDEERARAVALFKQLYRILFLEEHGKVPKDLLSRLEFELDEALSFNSRINPFLSYKGNPMFTIAMNPLYDVTHPRWSPCSILVITRHSDVKAVPKTVVDIIRSTIIGRIGHLYDADELYLSASVGKLT